MYWNKLSRTACRHTAPATIGLICNYTQLLESFFDKLVCTDIMKQRWNKPVSFPGVDDIVVVQVACACENSVHAIICTICCILQSNTRHLAHTVLGTSRNFHSEKAKTPPTKHATLTPVNSPTLSGSGTEIPKSSRISFENRSHSGRGYPHSSSCTVCSVKRPSLKNLRPSATRALIALSSYCRKEAIVCKKTPAFSFLLLFLS